MKRRVIAFLVPLIGLISLAKGDTIALKDGREIKGDIISQDSDQVVIEYFATPTIKDQKTVSRDQILTIISIPEDEKAFSALGPLVSPATLLDTSFHDLMLDKKIPEFTQRYSYSSHLSELREDARLPEDERSRLRHGDRKINGTWITVDQIQKDPYAFGATIKFAQMKALSQTNDPVGALQCYELLERDYPGARVMPDAVDLAIAQIALLQGNLNQAKANLGVIEKSRTNDMAQLPADQAKQLKDSLDKDGAAAKTTMTAATTDGTKFFPVFPNNREALDSLQSLVNSENTRLLQLQALPMREGLKASGECSRLVASGKSKEAQDELALSIKLWPANIENARLQKQIDNLIKAGSSTQNPTKP